MSARGGPLGGDAAGSATRGGLGARIAALLRRLADLGALGREAADAVLRHRGRSALTMLGIVIGTASVIAVLGTGLTAASGIDASLASLGDPGILLRPDPQADDPASASFRVRDARVVESENGESFRRVFPVFDEELDVRTASRTVSIEVDSATGVVLDDLTLREGRRIGEADVAAHARVCLLTGEAAAKLYPGDAGSLVGRDVRLDGSRFTIVGVYDAAKASVFNTAGSNETLEIPYTDFPELGFASPSELQVFPRPGVGADDVRRVATASLARIHGPDVKYTVQDVTALFAGFAKVTTVIAIGVGAIGGVALVVAGIGVTNIMLVSVFERTREIGIRRAIGARRSAIVLQFLAESVLLCVAGGAVGLALGLAFDVVAEKLISGIIGPASIPIGPICAAALGVSTLVGVGFGTYPAVRASRLDPIEALRT